MNEYQIGLINGCILIINADYYEFDNSYEFVFFNDKNRSTVATVSLKQTIYILDCTKK